MNSLTLLLCLAVVWDSVYGQHDAGWLSVYDFFNRHFGFAEKAAGLFETAKACGWVWPFEKLAIITDRPAVLRFDDAKRLHCATGPAIKYLDGFAVHAWHGTRVPAEWIETPDALTAAVALSQTNTDMRIAAIQILGWAKMIDQLEAKVVNRHPEGLLGGELLAVAKSKIGAGTSGTMKILRAECPRNGIVAFRVPDEITTAHEAQAWKAGLPADIYRLPAIRT